MLTFRISIYAPSVHRVNNQIPTLMNQPRIAADWTSRKSYMEQYRKDNREAINQRKREWRLKKKFSEVKTVFTHGTDAER